MGRKFVGLIVLLAFCALGYLMWKHYHEQQELDNGDVQCDGCMTPAEHDRFLKENSGDTADGQSEHKTKTASQEAATDFQDGGNATASNAVTSSATPVETPVAQPVTAPTPAPTPAPAASSPSLMTQVSQAITGSAAPPTTDTLGPNAPNGMAFGGKGVYQWYRQGNLTWRLDTTTGRSCIVFATMEEWRKEIVYSHGCGRNA